MKRRALVGSAAVAAAATVAGASWAWWRSENATRVDAREPIDASLWSMRFATPSGGELAMSTLQGKPLVLNFWATWCLPCLHEMPELDRFHSEFRARNWQVLGVALDRPGPVKAFLIQRPVGFAIALAEGPEGFDLIHRLGNGRGVLPFTVVFDRAGRLVRRKVGETSFDELAGWARAA
jgi:thiol-disulfide isomerase/thioredoxin